MRLRKMKKTDDDFKPVCSLMDKHSDPHTFLDVERYDDYFSFMMYDIKDKKKRRSSDIVVKDRDALMRLVEFLNEWDFTDIEKMFVECNCGFDALKFTKVKKDYYNEEEDSVYIDYYWSFHGRVGNRNVIEVEISKDQALVLANQLMNSI